MATALLAGDSSYAGVGSRKCDPNLAPLMRALGYFLASKGLRLQSGHAPGPDEWFEQGCNAFMLHSGTVGLKEIWLPWNGFEGGYDGDPTGHFKVIRGMDLDMAKLTLHDTGVCNWLHKLSQGIQKLYCRNVYQILRGDWQKVDFVIFAAPENVEKGTVAGGTRVAVILARVFDIPTYNLMHEDQRKSLYERIGFSEVDYVEITSKLSSLWPTA